MLLVSHTEFLKTAAADPQTRGQSVAQAWLMLWLLGATLGAVSIGRAIAQGAWPWVSLLAAQKWVAAPACTFVMLKTEAEFGGSAGRLLRKLMVPLVLSAVSGWLAYSSQAAKWVAHLVG